MSRFPPAAFSRDSSPASRQPLKMSKEVRELLAVTSSSGKHPHLKLSSTHSATHPPLQASPGAAGIFLLAFLLSPLSGLQVL